MKKLLSIKIDDAKTYQDYRGFLDCLVAQNQTSGLNQDPERVSFTKLNLQRMKRIEKSGRLSVQLGSVLKNLKKEILFLLIVEAWCGDAAQNIPYLQLMAAESAAIKLRIILRDAHLDLMDQFLTNGSRSIPKVIVVDTKDNAVLFTWGPRPKVAQDAVLAWKVSGIEHHDFMMRLHKWYAKDKGEELQNEFLTLLKNL